MASILNSLAISESNLAPVAAVFTLVRNLRTVVPASVVIAGIIVGVVVTGPA